MKRLAVCATLLCALQPVAWPAERAKAKASYLKKADQDLQSWSAKVDRLQKKAEKAGARTREELDRDCLLYTSPSPRDRQKSRMPSSA